MTSDEGRGSGIFCCVFTLPESRVCVMGILNVTPDSFSDGGDFVEADAANKRGIEMFGEGADIVDVGGESTRPGAIPVAEKDELDRVLPVVEELSKHGPVSIDTSKPQVARRCIAAGAKILNDVTGFSSDQMRKVAAESDVSVCTMHMRGEPRTMQDNPKYDDVVADVREFLRHRASELQAAGVKKDAIWLDPGIGFGKTVEHNLELLSRLSEIADLGYPVLVGVSRKSFIGKITGEGDPRERLGGSLAAACAAVQQGARLLRVHDVRQTVQFLQVWAAVS